MLRVLTIGLAVVVILSCVTALIRSDFADDIHGVLHQHHSVRGHKLLVVLLRYCGHLWWLHSIHSIL